MPVNLVKRAVEEAKDCEPLMRAMALLCGARVLAAVDIGAAKQAFAAGVATVGSLLLDARQLELILEEAVRIGATADPRAAVALFRRLPSGEHHMSRNSTGSMLVQSLAQSGEVETALGLLEDLGCETGGAQAVIHFASDPALQRRAMLAARERWRALRKRSDSSRDRFAHHEFYRLFSQHWRKLEAEAESWLDEILLAIGTDPDHPTRAGFGGRVELHSMNDMHLFEIFNVLRELKTPDQVELIIRDHPEVADAVKVYPLGLESLMTQQRPVQEGGHGGGGFGYVSSGSGSDRRLVAGMMAAHRGDPSAIQHLLAEARHLHMEDTDADDPNLAPRVFWPSCHAYKVAMYWAGKSLEKDAEPLLAQIPDSGFALLASIELAAGALGLPQHSGVRMEHHPKRTHRT